MAIRDSPTPLNGPGKYLVTMSPRALVVGAGAGGLALAIYLAEQGMDVEVLEKQGQPGGRCGRLSHGGHRFDLGATLLLMPRLCRSVFRDWGEDLDARVALRRLDPIYTLHFEGRGSFAFSSDRSRLSAELERREPGASAAWARYDALGRRQYRVLMARFLARNFDGPGDYFNLPNLYWFLRLGAHRRHTALARRYFRNPDLQAAFTLQNIYLGQSPFRSSGAFALLPAMEVEQGGWYPMGGMHSLVQALTQIAGSRGVRIRCGAEVAGILAPGGVARGVRLADGSRVDADIVVSNADLPYACDRLLSPPATGRARRRPRFASSAIVFHWALSRPADRLGHHGIFLGDDYAAGFDRIFRHAGAGPPTHFYVNRPTHTDPSCAPPGRDTVSVVLPAPCHDPARPLDWDRLDGEARNLVLRRLEAAGMGDLGPAITFEACITPPAWERMLNLTRGSVFGSLDHGLDQIGYLRPDNRHPRVRGLYFVGGSTRPGSGVPLVLLSARLTAQRIFRDQGIRDPLSHTLEY
jgi:phytoene desaturase